MGGFGSGRHFYDAKATTNSYRRMDVRRWQRDKLLAPNNSFGWQWISEGEVIASIRVDVAADLSYVTLRYKNKKRDEEWKSFDYNIRLTWGDCHLGGRRPWFICPVKICNRRVAILYGGSVFACRHCYNLAYKSQRESTCDRATRRAEKIREKLKWDPGVLNGDQWKPKGMHWRTFERLCAQHEDFVDVVWREARLRFGININDYM